MFRSPLYALMALAALSTCHDPNLGDTPSPTPEDEVAPVVLIPGSAAGELAEVDEFPYAHAYESLYVYALEGEPWVWVTSGTVFEEGETGNWIGELTFQIWPSQAAYARSPKAAPCTATGTVQGLVRPAQVPTCDGCERYYSVTGVMEAYRLPIPPGCDPVWLQALAPIYAYAWHGYRQADRAGWPSGVDGDALEADGWTGVLYSDDLRFDMADYYLVRPLDL